MLKLSDTQIRLIILFAIKSFKISMSAEYLQEVLVWQKIVDYFTMHDFLLDMQGMELISTVVIDGETRYDITEKGLETVDMFNNKIPPSMRKRIYDKCYELLLMIRRGRTLVTDIEPIDDERFMAKCGVYEHGVPLIELKIYAGSRKHAVAIADKFKEKSGELYGIILEKIVETEK